MLQDRSHSGLTGAAAGGSTGGTTGSTGAVNPGAAGGAATVAAGGVLAAAAVATTGAAVGATGAKTWAASWEVSYRILPMSSRRRSRSAATPAERVASSAAAGWLRSRPQAEQIALCRGVKHAGHCVVEVRSVVVRGKCTVPTYGRIRVGWGRHCSALWRRVRLPLAWTSEVSAGVDSRFGGSFKHVGGYTESVHIIGFLIGMVLFVGGLVIMGYSFEPLGFMLPFGLKTRAWCCSSGASSCRPQASPCRST